MSTYTASIRWSAKPDEDYRKGQYSRVHEWLFDCGVFVPASARPHIVPVPWSDAGCVDPEEAFIASLSSCHMLFFLNVVRRAGFAVATYTDDAEGVLAKREDGRMAMSKVTLQPRITWDGAAPDAMALAELQYKAHEACFIANSVTIEVVVD